MVIAQNANSRGDEIDMIRTEFNDMSEIEVKVVGYKTQHGRNRYKVVSKETEEVLDDAQGNGYKSISNAYAAWSWKQGKHSKKKKKKSNSGTLPEFVSIKAESGIEQAKNKVIN